MSKGDLEKNLPNNNFKTVNITACVPTLPNSESEYTYRLSKTVRLLAVIDFFFGFLMFLFGSWGYFVFLRLMVSISGYYGAKYYNYCSTLLYQTFLIMSTLGELVLIYVYSKLYQDNQISKNILVFGILYQLIFFSLKAYIYRFVCKFTSRIAKLNELDKNTLISYDSQPAQIIYW